MQHLVIGHVYVNKRVQLVLTKESSYISLFLTDLWFKLVLRIK